MNWRASPPTSLALPLRSGAVIVAGGRRVGLRHSESPMRIAVCISGRPRAVRVCVDSLRVNLLGEQPCDFFVHS